MDYAGMGRKIRRKRSEMDVTQQEIAKMAGVSASYIGNIERGARVMALETMKKYVKRRA